MQKRERLRIGYGLYYATGYLLESRVGFCEQRERRPPAVSGKHLPVPVFQLSNEWKISQAITSDGVRKKPDFGLIHGIDAVTWMIFDVVDVDFNHGVALAGLRLCVQ